MRARCMVGIGGIREGGTLSVLGGAAARSVVLVVEVVIVVMLEGHDGRAEVAYDGIREGRPARLYVRGC